MMEVSSVNKILDFKVKKESFTKNGQTYNITYSSNTPSDEALREFAKKVLKMVK